VGDTPIIFSSWLGPLATGEIKDGGFEGSFEDHVIAAVSYIQTLTGTTSWKMHSVKMVTKGMF